MREKIGRAATATIIACASVLACDGVLSRECSSRACAAELGVSVHGLADAEYTVIASADGEEVRTATCTVGPTADSCSVYFAYFHPAEVTVRVVWADQEVVEQFTPSYETTYPNGPDCWPTCYEATVAVNVGHPNQPSNKSPELTR